MNQSINYSGWEARLKGQVEMSQVETLANDILIANETSANWNEPYWDIETWGIFSDHRESVPAAGQTLRQHSVPITALRLDQILSIPLPTPPSLLRSVSDGGVLFECGAQGGQLLGKPLQHLVLHVGLEGAVEVLEGIWFVHREDLCRGKVHTVSHIHVGFSVKADPCDLEWDEANLCWILCHSRNYSHDKN